MLAGYASRKELSQGVHDPISARVVAFEQNGKKLVLVSTDIIGFYGGTAASMRKAILAACGLQPSELFLAAIHTHSAPIVSLGGEGPPQQRRVYEVAGIAVGRRRARGPGPHGPRADRRGQRFLSRGREPARVRRRTPPGKPRCSLAAIPLVLTDREVQVLRVSRADNGELAAVVFAYATHSTAMGPHNYLVSGDVHGLAAQFLEKYLAGRSRRPGLRRRIRRHRPVGPRAAQVPHGKRLGPGGGA